jgi:hypothetical protein
MVILVLKPVDEQVIFRVNVEYVHSALLEMRRNANMLLDLYVGLERVVS